MFKRATVLAGAFLGLSAMPAIASATTYVINPIVDLSGATTYPNGFLTAPLAGNEVVLSPGDIITGHLSFANGDRIVVTDNNFLTGFEWITAELYDPIDGDAVSYYTMSFTDVAGDFLLTQPLWQFSPPFGPGSWNGALGALYVDNMTNSSFSFGGIDFNIEYHEGTATQFAPGAFWGGGFGALSVAPGVPEPSTWSMMLVGFGALGMVLRRRKSQASLSGRSACLS